MDHNAGSISGTWTAPARISSRVEDQHAHDDLDISGGIRSLPTTWSPLSLRTLSLIGFTALFAVLCLTLVLIWTLTRQTGGFDLIVDNHYLWVYGPTAFLILIISLWRQLDYNCKILTPWKELSLGDRPACKTLLLDYVSPLQLITLYQAITNRHMGVVLTTLGFLILKLITIASTGLLIATNVQTSISDRTLLTTTTFNYPRIGNTLSGVNLTSPIYLAYGYLLKGMSPSDGVTTNMAYQSITLPVGSNVSNATYAADVRSLSPSFKCQRLTLPDMQETQTAFTDSITDLNYTISPSCNFTGTQSICNPGNVRCPSSEITFLHVTTDCGVDGQAWWYFSEVEWSYNQTLSDADNNATVGQPVNASDWTMASGNDSTWLCRLDYKMQLAHVVYDTSQSPPMVSVTNYSQSSTPALSGLSAANLSTEITTALTHSNLMLGDGDLLFKIAQAYINGTQEMFLHNPDMLGPTLETIMSQIAAEVVSQVAMQDTTTNIVGSMTSPQSRLQLSEVVLGLMAGGFVLMILITAGVFWTRPVGVELSERVDTIKTIAMLLPQSMDFHGILKGRWRCNETAGTKNLQDVQCSLKDQACDNERVMRIDVCHLPPVESSPEQGKVAQQTWWRPLTLMQPILAITIITPLILIVVLELLQRQSNREHGFVAINPNTTDLVRSAYTRFLPALVMLLVATLFTSFDFNSAVLAPLNSLRTGHANSHRIISTSVLGKLPPLALLTALENKQWSAAFTATAAFIGSVLTITVSGLYTIEFVPSTTAFSLARYDSFHLGWNNSAIDDGGSAVLLSMIESANLTYPSLTYDGLVFPNLTAIMDDQHIPHDASGLIQLKVPALRGNLDCQNIMPPQVNWTFHNISQIQNWMLDVQASVPLPPSCLRGGKFGNETTLDLLFSHGFPTANAGRWNYAELLDLHVGPYGSSIGSATGEIDPSANFDNPSGCPTLALSYGWADTQRNMTNTNLLVCNQQIQQVETTLTLTYPNLTIPQAHPPIPNEQVVQTLSSGLNNVTAFPFRLEKNFADSFSLFNPSPAFAAVSDKLQFDHFFTGVLFGKENYDFSVFYDWNTNGRFRVATQNFYRRYMAQVINTKMRISQPANVGVNNTLAASLSLGSGTPRIVQHNTSKLILQVMLGIMFTLGLMALQFGKFHKIVPWNPCTIAGIAVLLTGSEICEPTSSNPVTIIDDEKRISTTTEIIDNHEGTPLIGHDEPSHRNSAALEIVNLYTENPVKTPLWEVFSTPNRELRQEQRHKEETSRHNFDLRNAHLRLGWWRDGDFFGDAGPSQKEREQDQRIGITSRWRYGIDEEVYRNPAGAGSRSRSRVLSDYRFSV